MQRTRRRNIPCPVGADASGCGWWVPKCVQLGRLVVRFPRSSFCEGSRCTHFGWVGTSPSISAGRQEKVVAPSDIYAHPPHQVAPSPRPAKGSVPPNRPAASLIKATARAKTPQVLAATSTDALRLPVGLVRPAHMPNSNVNSYFVVGPSPNGVRPLLLAASLTATERLKR